MEKLREGDKAIEGERKKRWRKCKEMQLMQHRLFFTCTASFAILHTEVVAVVVSACVTKKGGKQKNVKTPTKMQPKKIHQISAQKL